MFSPFLCITPNFPAMSLAARRWAQLNLDNCCFLSPTSGVSLYSWLKYKCNFIHALDLDSPSSKEYSVIVYIPVYLCRNLTPLLAFRSERDGERPFRKLPTGRIKYAACVSVQMRKELGTMWISNASLVWIHFAGMSSTWTASYSCAELVCNLEDLR